MRTGSTPASTSCSPASHRDRLRGHRVRRPQRPPGLADAGIPSGGLFSGAEDVKTPEQAARHGGTAGVAYDACHHQACDDLDDVSQLALDQNSDAVAYAVLTIADAGTGPGQGNG